SAQTTFGTSEDNKSMGYPDGRKIVRDSSGNLYAAYRKKFNSRHQIFVSKSTNGGSSWFVTNGATPISVVDGDFDQRVPSIAIDSNNTLHVVWYGRDHNFAGTDERQIKYSRSFDGGNSWTAWQNIATVDGYNGESLWQEHPVVYFDRGNTIYVVWEGRDRDHDSQQAKFIKSTDGGNSWTDWKNIGDTPTGNNQSRPTIVVDANGKIFVICYGFWTNSKQNILYSTSTNGGASFSAWNAVNATNDDQRHPSAAIDSGDKIHLVWREENSVGKTEIRYSKYTSPNWSASSAISVTSGSFQFFPSIANASGSQYVVWTETTDSSGFPSENPATGRIVFAKRLQGSSTWAKSNVTSVANNVWGSIRWSANTLNGGTIDIVFQAGSASPFSLKYQSLGTWGQ
ncbi:MAG: sialidase family protein, partial [Pyrinomonadaceae bacterium]